jgi:NAD(P)-dependent dehydrogenase (short-subunit alcohol dehydrogenase family)
MNVEDRLALQDRYVQIAYGMDSNDAECWTGVFAEDGELVFVEGGNSFSGRAAIRAVAFLMTRAVSRHMIELGRIGNIISAGSANSLGGTPKEAHYTAAKHGLIGFTKAIAVDLAAHGIRCNPMCPGGIDTPMTAGLMGITHGEWLAGVTALTGPWNLFDSTQMLEPEEVTRAIMWRASDASDFVAGQSIVVDAGFSIK